jgi:BON domain
MPREDYRDLESERLRRLRDRDRDRDDYGQADYSNLYGYDSRTRSGYRAYDDGRSYSEAGPVRPESEWDYGPERRRLRRRGPSDRVLWAVIMERLDDERHLDLRDVEVEVQDGEVTLNGVVRRKDDKRRIEDVADIEGVHNVQNNLRVRDRGRGWTFL